MRRRAGWKSRALGAAPRHTRPWAGTCSIPRRTIAAELRAAHLLRLGAEHGDSDAALGLAIYHGEGRGGEVPDIAQTVRYYKLAAEAGGPMAQWAVGNFHYEGKWAPRSEQLAAHWYAKAAEQGHAPAQCFLASMHEHGQAVGQSVAEAVRPYSLASAQGYPLARLRLGEMLVKGDAEGLPADPAAGACLIAWASGRASSR